MRVVGSDKTEGGGHNLWNWTSVDRAHNRALFFKSFRS